MRAPVDHKWRSIILEDRILTAEQPVTRQLKRSYDLQYLTLALIVARWVFRKDQAQSDQWADSINPYHLPDGIIEVAKVSNKYPTLSHIKIWWLRVVFAETAIAETI